MRTLSIWILAFLLYACEWPFDTTPTDSDSLFALTIEHNITRLVDSAGVKIAWREITLEDFSEVTVERRSPGDTAWTLRATLTNPLLTSYEDMVSDDQDFRYRVTLLDIRGNAKWAEGETTIPKTTSLYVPIDYKSIQSAFETPVMDDGDSILVEPGTYEGTLAVLGKKVLVQATGGYGVTSVVATDGKRCISINDGILEGFRLEGGTGGEGVSTPGGGVFASGSAILRNNFIVDNRAPGEGGGIFLTGNASLYNNIVFRNVGNTVGGIFISNAKGEVINNTIVGDTSGGVAIASSSVTFLNNIMTEHKFFDLLVSGDASESVVAYCRFKEVSPEDTLGNIADDPLFLDVVNQDFHLDPDSPCIDAGHPGDEYRDRDGSRNDMGAYGGPYVW